MIMAHSTHKHNPRPSQGHFYTILCCLAKIQFSQTYGNGPDNHLPCMASSISCWSLSQHGTCSLVQRQAPFSSHTRTDPHSLSNDQALTMKCNTAPSFSGLEQRLHSCQRCHHRCLAAMEICASHTCWC